MKILLIITLTIFSIAGCGQSSTKEYGSLLNTNSRDLNPNSITNQQEKERQNQVKLSKIDSNTKIEIARIESNNKLQIAKVNAEVEREVAQTDSNTKIQTTKIDAVNKKEDIQSRLYIAIGLMVLFIVVLVLLYLNNKKSRELQNKLHQDKLNHEKELREREFEENRMHKILELVAEGKLSPKMEEEVIQSLTKPKEKPIATIENK